MSEAAYGKKLSVGVVSIYADVTCNNMKVMIAATFVVGGALSGRIFKLANIKDLISI